MLLNHSHRRWPLFVGAGLLLAGLALFGYHSGAREAAAQDENKKPEQIQEELRKALDSLKKGPEPAKEAEKPADLNPVDEMRRAEEALRKAKKDLQDNPTSEEARKALEDATRKYQEAMK